VEPHPISRAGEDAEQDHDDPDDHEAIDHTVMPVARVAVLERGEIAEIEGIAALGATRLVEKAGSRSVCSAGWAWKRDQAAMRNTI
jgi:hypothetical protein